MTKPWEENWVAIDGTANVVEAGQGGRPLEHRVLRTHSISELGGGSSTPAERARFAAAAPDMARLLIEVYNRVNDPLADRVVEVLERAGVLTVTRAKFKL